MSITYFVVNNFKHTFLATLVEQLLIEPGRLLELLVKATGNIESLFELVLHY